MTTQRHLPGLRPALSGLPPTLQPHAVLAYAPPTDRRRSAAMAAGVYALLAGGVIWVAQIAPVAPKPQALPPHDTVIIESPRSTPAPASAHPAISHPMDAPPVAVPAPAPVDMIPATPSMLPTQNLSTLPPAPVPPTGPAEGEGTGDGGGPLAISGDAVRILRQVSPAYPALALAAHKQGEVVIRMVIDPTGVPVSAEAVSGPQVFYGPAVAAARQWRFSPATQNGQPVPATFLLTLRFILR